ncbi:MAG: glycosyltransferase [Acidobacteria bacterium]|nr:glycosyltransferase [Acidobacteriota bacterium]
MKRAENPEDRWTPTEPSSPAPPKLSVLIPARNEERNIAGCLASLLPQGEEIEILVADDGSEDRTAAIVSEFCCEHPRVKRIPVPPLPKGWLGKNHAAHVAAQQSRGEWLLFTDADTRHEPSKLPEMLQWAETVGLDGVSLSPQQRVESWWEKAVIPLVYRQLAKLYPYERVNDSSDPIAAANGQFILIKRTVYESLGGHEALREALLEDVELARRAKQAGYRLWFGPGQGIVSTRMYRSFPEMWEGWTKNLYLLYHRDGRDGRALSRAVIQLSCRYILPVAAGTAMLLAGTWAAGLGLLLWAYAAHEHVAYWRVLKREGNAGAAPWLIPGAVLVCLLLLNSLWRYRGRKDIVWKGRRYRIAAED